MFLRMRPSFREVKEGSLVGTFDGVISRGLTFHHLDWRLLGLR